MRTGQGLTAGIGDGAVDQRGIAQPEVCDPVAAEHQMGFVPARSRFLPSPALTLF